MTLAPRFLVNFWAKHLSAKLARHLKSPGHDVAAQHTAFARLMAQVERTAFGRQHGLTSATTYAEFRQQVPPRPYEGFQPWIARMAAGETDVLLPGKCPLFVETAGTTGTPKLLPAPGAMLAHFRSALRDALFLYANRAGHARVFLGRHLQIGASTGVSEERGTWRTSLDGLLALCVSPWAEANLLSPPAAVAQMPEGSAKIDAAARAMLRRDVTLVAGTPALLCALSLTARESAGSAKRRITQLQAVWPNLECCLHTGAPLGFFGDALRATLGPAVKLHEIYAAAEGLFAAQDAGTPAGWRLLADAGVFFEFLPLASFNEATVERTGALCVPLEKVQAGADYVLVITTPAGLCRYVTGDIVRLVSAQPARLQFGGRTGLLLDAQGERVTERELFESLQAVCTRHGWQPIAFHVAPYQQRLGPGQSAHVHEWWLELVTHTVKTPMANVLGPELDAELARRSPDYALRRSRNLLGAPLVRLVIPGIFERWATKHGKTASASKLPRCRPDRLIADQLAELAPFHQAIIVTPKDAIPR